MKNTLFRSLALAVALPGAFCAFAAEESSSVETKAAVASARKLDESKLSPASLKVAKLLQAGMDEKVIVAYVKNNPASKAPSAEELVYLHELGTPSSVLTALLTETKKTPVVGPAKVVAVAAPAEQVEVTSNYTPIPGAPQPQANGSTAVSTPVAAPAPVIVQQPAPPTVVYTQPAPVYVSPPPVYYDPASRITFGFGFGHFGHFGHHHRHHSIFRHHHHGHWGHHRGRHH